MSMNQNVMKRRENTSAFQEFLYNCTFDKVECVVYLFNRF